MTHEQIMEVSICLVKQDLGVMDVKKLNCYKA